MGVLDSLGTEHANLVQNVMTLQAALQARHTAPPSIAAFEGMGYASQHVDAAYSADTPPAGIFGVGVADLHDQLRPVVFVLMDLMTAPVEMPSDAGVALTPAKKLISSYDISFTLDLVLIGLPRVRNFGHVCSGSAITVGTQKSALGVPAAFADGRRGYLTAGHGAGYIGDQVLVGDLLVGSVVISSSRELAPTTAAVADVAAIALDSAIVEVPTGAPPITVVDNPSPGFALLRQRILLS